MNLKRFMVSGLNRLCTWVDAVAYRPAVVKATLRLPRWWQCDLAKLSMRLDDRWQTGWWDADRASMAPHDVCEVCGRRAAWLVVGGYDDEYGPADADDFLATRQVDVCAWCKLPGDGPITDEKSLERAVKIARARSIAWRWRWSA